MLHVGYWAGTAPLGVPSPDTVEARGLHTSPRKSPGSQWKSIFFFVFSCRVEFMFAFSFVLRQDLVYSALAMKLTMQSRMVSNLWQSCCLSLSCTGLTCLNHHSGVSESVRVHPWGMIVQLLYNKRANIGMVSIALFKPGGAASQVLSPWSYKGTVGR